MKKINELIELLLFFTFTLVLGFLFLINLPIFEEPHGLLIMNELSDFSSNQLAAASLFGSIIVCIGLGALMMKWLPLFTPGMTANLWATTYFLMWVDSMFALSVQAQSFHYLVLLGLQPLFSFIFSFSLCITSVSSKRHEPGTGRTILQIQTHPLLARELDGDLFHCFDPASL